jgi:hypothetical protein
MNERLNKKGEIPQPKLLSSSNPTIPTTSTTTSRLRRTLNEENKDISRADLLIRNAARSSEVDGRRRSLSLSPAVEALFQTASERQKELKDRYGQTLMKWKSRSSNSSPTTSVRHSSHYAFSRKNDFCRIYLYCSLKE